MLIAIISDTHDNIPNIKKVLDYCRKNKIEKLFHCGDLAEMETFKFIRKNFSGDIFWTFGNMDSEHFNISEFRHLSNEEKIKIFETFGETNIDKMKIAFVHFPDKAKKLCESGNYDFVFYGHTHKPWSEKIGKCTMLNPGNVANQYYPPTFAVWDSIDNKFSLVRINELK